MTEFEFELGQRVTFSNPLSRVLRREEAPRYGMRGPTTLKVWVAEEAEPREGVIVGKRTLANGARYMEEWGYAFDPEEHFEAYLISFDIRRKPVYVRAENITPFGDFCPFDCDSCHDPDCPCDRMGCEGSGVRFDS